jgi:hypothetical protein
MAVSFSSVPSGCAESSVSKGASDWLLQDKETRVKRRKRYFIPVKKKELCRLLLNEPDFYFEQAIGLEEYRAHNL